MANCPPNCITVGSPLWQLYDITDNNPEFCLYESVASEFVDIAGFPIMYYRAISNMDRLYGEDANQDFAEPVQTKIAYEPSEEPNIIDMFGIRSDDVLQYALMTKQIFSRDVGEEFTPMPGDVIKTLWNNRNYEVVDIGSEQNIFQARKLIWEFILRPFRFSEQSQKADEIHRGRKDWNYIYIYPEGGLADVIYHDGTQDIGVDVSTLTVDLTGLDCGVKYARNEDGSYDIIEEVLVVDPDKDPHPEYLDTGLPLEDTQKDKFGDDSWIEVESDKIDNYGDVDTKIFGY